MVEEPWSSPRHVGPYQIHGVLGSGGMGVVYRGKHVDTGEAVAIKTIRAVTRTQLSGIRQEIHALTHLAHPGIVRIVASGIANGLPWYAMELIDGQTLRAHIRERLCADLSLTIGDGSDAGDIAMSLPRPSSDSRPTLDLAESLGIIWQLCSPLAYLHGQGIVHRDLKPDNIFIRPDGTPVIVDLGVSSQFASEGGREPLSSEGHLAGSLAYMAPEQRAGELVDARADLYALGVILFECITGQLPPTHSNWDARRPLAPDLSPQLDAVVRRLLAPRPADRFGYAEDVARALEQVAPTTHSHTAAAVTSYVYRSDLVGRDDIMASLEAAVTGLARDRSGGGVFLSGESGAGKTRLAVEVTKLAARRPITVVTCECTTVDVETTPDGRRPAGAPLEVLRPVLVAAADRGRELGAAEIERLFGPRSHLLAQYEPTVAALARESVHPEPSPLPPQEARAQVLAAFGEVVLALTDAMPLLLVIDDLQWIDELSLAALAWLLQSGLTGRPLLVLGTFRSEGLDGELAELLRFDGARVIEVVRLDERGVDKMVAGMLALPNPPRALVDFVARNTEGNPFFVAEYLRTAISDGALERTSTGEWRLNPQAAEPDALPAGLSQPRALAALLNRRLGGLDEASRAVVEWGALLGREFDAELVAAGFELDDADLSKTLAETLRTLRLRHILKEPHAGQLRFVHDKIREGAYERIAGDRRRALHERAGFMLEHRHPNSTELAPTLAHHFARAQLHDHASHHYARAADRARSAYANNEAIAQYRQAIDQARRFHADSSEPPAQPLAPDEQLLEAIGDLLAITGRQAEAKDACLEAIALLDPAARNARSRLYRKAGKAWETHHRHDEALRCYALAEQALADEPANDDAEASAWFGEWFAVQMARTWVYYWLAQVEELAALVETVRPVVERRATPLERAHFFQSLMHMDLRRDRYVAAARTVEFARASMAASSESGDVHEICGARFALGFTLLFHGALAESEATLALALAEAERLGDVPTQTRCLTYLMVVHRLRGDVATTRSTAKQVLAVADSGKMIDYLAAAHANLGWAALRDKDTAGSEAALRQVMEIWRSIGFEYPLQWMGRLPMIAHVVNTGAPIEQAREHARALLDTKQQQLPESLAAQLEAAATQSNPDQARALFTLAIGRAFEIGYL